MLQVAAFAFISPFFGLQLELDASVMQVSPEVSALVATDAAPLDGALLAEVDVPRDDAATDLDPTTTAATTSDVAPVDPDASADPEEGERVDVAAQMARRARFARAHRRLGMATWGAMTAAVITGTLQYANQYGFFAPVSQTRCVRGDAFYGQSACSGTPWPHAASAGITAALYYTTFAISFAMPDPIGLDRGNSESARTLRSHKRLRWVHFSGMALQAVLGSLVANPGWIGLDRANDYRALQALATVHLLSGYATYGVLTYTGARMAF